MQLEAGVRDGRVTDSAVSLREIGMLIAKGRLARDVALRPWRDDMIQGGAIVLPVEADVPLFQALNGADMVFLSSRWADLAGQKYSH